ncbi:unnamed protein product, partial [Larinioides sclopetarius]
MTELRLFYDGKEFGNPIQIPDADFEESIPFIHSVLPGRHVAKALVYDEAIETVSVAEEVEIFISDTKVSFDLDCPEFLITGDTGICNVVILRGTDLQVKLKFGNDEEEGFVIPDSTVVPVGFPVPYLPPLNSPEASEPPEVVYVSVGELPFSILAGFDFLAKYAGSFDVQVLAPKCNDGEKFCGKCDTSCPERGTSVCAEKESFYSFAKACVDSTDDTARTGSLQEGDLEEIRSFSLEAKEPGYNYHPLEESDYTELQPGYIIALKRGDSRVVEYVDAGHDDEKWTGFVDRDEGGELLNVHHFLRPVVIIPMNISFPYNFTK